MAAITDKFAKVLSGTTRPVATTLSAQKLVGATSATVNATTGWDTDTAVHGIMYRVNASNQKIAGSQIDWKATISGTTLSNFTVTAGSDDTYEVGTVVELSPTAAWGDDMATGILVSLDQDGTLKAGAVDNKDVLANDVVETAKIKDANVTTAKLADASVTSAKVATGIPVQVVNATFSAVATGTGTGNIIPNDDTIPQNTEGTEFMTVTITPKSATNILVIQANTHLASANATQILTTALFQDSTANALAVATEFSGASTDVPFNIPLTYTMTAGTTSATTFKIRGGSHQSSTTTFNGVSGARKYGAIPKSSIVVTEYKA